MKRKYVFKPYNPVFTQLFEQERQRIQAVLGNKYPIEHFGSTAVPGLGGKGIIDICIAVPADEMEDISLLVQGLGYDFHAHAGDEGRLFFQTDLPDELEGIRRYHVHVMNTDYPLFKKNLRVRDYLCRHTEDREAYAEAKKVAAEAANEDGKEYMRLKEGVLGEIIAEADRWEELEEEEWARKSIKAVNNEDPANFVDIDEFQE